MLSILKIAEFGQTSIMLPLKSFYDFYEVHVGDSFPWTAWRHISESIVPSKVQFFVWTAMRGHISTVNKLRKRGNVLPNVSSMP